MDYGLWNEIYGLLTNPKMARERFLLFGIIRGIWSLHFSHTLLSPLLCFPPFSERRLRCEGGSKLKNKQNVCCCMWFSLLILLLPWRTLSTILLSHVLSHSLLASAYPYPFIWLDFPPPFVDPFPGSLPIF